MANYNLKRSEYCAMCKQAFGKKDIKIRWRGKYYHADCLRLILLGEERAKHLEKQKTLF